jgi:putative transposase
MKGTFGVIQFCMTLKRTPHALYDTKYHLVWTPKYRRWIDRKEIRSRVEEIFKEIASNHQMEIDRIEVSADHVHIFLSFPPRYSIAKVVGMFKSISASIIFEQYPEIKEGAKAMAKQFLGERIFCKDSRG